MLLVIAAILLCTGAGALILAAGRASLARYKPEWLLVVEARHLRGPAAGPARRTTSGLEPRSEPA
ncbi:MAG: hypothetical protein IPJ41_12755 [Phycisphaerales bacterium]|nr:hypothetical protein [Phycisphaerales bacterium]